MKEWREARGLTQRQLADLLGVDPMSISRWERETQHPPGRLLQLALERLAQRHRPIRPGSAPPPAPAAG